MTQALSQPTLTPAMRQWAEVKQRYPNHLVLFRMGDFYEMFWEDAEFASKTLEIALTSRGRDGDRPIPLAGVPFHALNGYLAKLVKAGVRVAICEQVEDPKTAKGVVKREVTRVVTPGVALEAETLDERANNYLMGLVRDGDRWGFTLAELTTGEFLMGHFVDDEKLVAEIVRREPAEILVPETMREDERLFGVLKAASAPMCSFVGEDAFEIESALASLDIQFPSDNVRGMDAEKLGPALRTAGGVLAYLLDTQMRELGHINRLRVYTDEQYMVVDETTKRNLELVSSLREGGRRGSLLGLLDRTVTAMGARLLRQWLLYPLLSSAEIAKRLDAVENLVKGSLTRKVLRELLGRIHDLERLAGRISLAACNARDLVMLKTSLDALPAVRGRLSELDAPMLADLARHLDDLSDVKDLVERAIDDEPPLSLRDGQIIKEGYDERLDELRRIARSGRGDLSEMETRERERTGIARLKIRYNRVFGYYIEISNANKNEIPADYIRKQTLVNAERYITEELKQYEETVLNAQERIVELEYELFVKVRETIGREVVRIQAVARRLATLDILATFAELAEDHDYVKPVVDDSDILEIEDGRHPVVERTNPGERFVPNDARLDNEANQILVITGPNMAGKSTYIRQVAVIALLAQIGSFVPAKRARLGVVDRIFTRVGASDNLARGQSTFMVEMMETAAILREATDKSLIILDEIGRGTSTFDGLSIAWAVTEFLHDRPDRRAKTLFATHFHELVDISREKTRVRNYNIGIIERDDRLIFLHRILPGGTNRSFGIQVARMAGLPDDVIRRAKEILANLERGELDEIGRARLARHVSGRSTPGQLQLFSAAAPSSVVEDALRAADPLHMTPLEAIQFLVELKNKVERQGETEPPPPTEPRTKAEPV